MCSRVIVRSRSGEMVGQVNGQLYVQKEEPEVQVQGYHPINEGFHRNLVQE